MTVKRASNSGILSKQTLSTNKNTWIRPDWVEIPDVLPTENVVYAVYPVYPTAYTNTGNQFCAVYASASTGSYTVDWGDGTSNTYTSGVTGTHVYEYSSHPNPVNSLGYKTTLVKITPTTSGNTLRDIRFNYRHPSDPSISLFKWLDIVANTTHNDAYINFVSTSQGCPLLERAVFNTKFKVTNALGYTPGFGGCSKLRVLPAIIQIDPTSTYLNNFFNGCWQLESIPELRGFNVTAANPTIAFSNFFSNCFAITEVPLLPIPSNISWSGVFTNCVNLREIPAYNIAPTSATSLFSGCVALQSVEKATFNFANTTTINTMFSNCYYITKLPSFSTLTNKCTDTSSAFLNCRLLTAPVPFGDSSGITNYNSMYSGCISITSLGDVKYNITAAKDVNGIFGNTNILDMVNPFTGTWSASYVASNFSAVLNPSQVVKRIKLATVPTNITSCSFPNYGAVSEMEAPIPCTFSIVNNCMSATNLNAMYTALPTVTSKTVNVTGNFGTTGDNPSIATAKGWTVTG
jgi:hypothetical protein